jgi:hypothetical protein
MGIYQCSNLRCAMMFETTPNFDGHCGHECQNPSCRLQMFWDEPDLDGTPKDCVHTAKRNGHPSCLPIKLDTKP